MKLLPRSRSTATEDTATDSLLSIMRTIGLGSLRRKIVAFTLLSLVGGLSQAVLLVLISEVAVAEVQGKHSIHTLGQALSPTEAIIVAFLALLLFFSTSMVAILLSTSVSEEALTSTRGRIVYGFFESEWSFQSTERLGHVQQLITVNSGATANVVNSLSTGLQSLLMVTGLLTVALVVDPLAALGVIAVGVLLSQLLRPLNKRNRRAYREVSRTTRAMATQVTEFTARPAISGCSAWSRGSRTCSGRSSATPGTSIARARSWSTWRPSCTSPSRSASSSSPSSPWPAPATPSSPSSGPSCSWCCGP